MDSNGERQMANEPDKWTVDQVLEHVPHLGIPHFQRGLVWGDESTAALLESLYHDTPCGSFVLWKPENCAEFGVAVKPSSESSLQYLIIDGQQRIRSLDSVFNGDSSGRTWCVNLAALAEFAKAATPQDRELSLFVKTVDPAKLRDLQRIPPGVRNLLPLQVVEGAESCDATQLEAYRRLLSLDKAAVAAIYPKLRQAVLDMRKGAFFVSVQRKGGLGEMVSLYNRINSSGKRVEAEERAFARLVGLKPVTYRELKTTFDKLHSDSPTATPAGGNRKGIDRDEVLKRQKERSFGFKLFVRVFLQVCQHRLAVPQGQREHSFDLAERASFITAFASLTSTEVEELWDETRHVLCLVRRVLRDELYCDDLRFLPDTISLTPVFQLLIHYPALSTEIRFRPLLANLCLRLLLAELDSRTLQDLTNLARDPSQVAFRVVPQILRTVHPKVQRKHLSRRLRESNSLQDRYVLLLYGLVRRRKARDFLYSKVDNAVGLVPPEKPVGEEVAPEKQHLVPFKKAQGIYPELRRTSSHVVNGVGNLTYISHALNHYDALGDQFAKLEAEPPDNQNAHLLIDERRSILDAYVTLRGELDQGSFKSRVGSQALFERMSKVRRELIVDAFEGWLVDMDRATGDSLGLDGINDLERLADAHDRLEPAPPRMRRWGAPGVAEVIRGLRYSNVDEDRLIELARFAKAKPKWEDGKPPYRLRITKNRKVWVKMSPAEVWLRFDPSVPVEIRQSVCGLLGITPSAETHVSLNPVPSFETLIQRIRAIDQQLAEGATKL